MYSQTNIPAGKRLAHKLSSVASRYYEAKRNAIYYNSDYIFITKPCFVIIIISV